MRNLYGLMAALAILCLSAMAVSAADASENSSPIALVPADGVADGSIDTSSACAQLSLSFEQDGVLLSTDSWVVLSIASGSKIVHKLGAITSLYEFDKEEFLVNGHPILIEGINKNSFRYGNLAILSPTDSGWKEIATINVPGSLTVHL